MNTSLYARLEGVLYDVCVKEGQRVKIGDALYIIEAAKSQLAVKAPYDGTVQRIARKPGDTVSASDLVLELAADKESGASG
jgi:biotin carboxyl carrier protein